MCYHYLEDFQQKLRQLRRSLAFINDYKFY